MQFFISRWAVPAILFGAFLATASAQEGGVFEAISASNVRSQSSINGSIVTILNKGEQVRVIGTERSGSWFKIEAADGTQGFVYGKLLKPVANAASAAAAQAAASPAEASSAGDESTAATAYFISPYSGEVIPGGKFWVRMGLRNMGVAPAGVERQRTGHHHLIVNNDLPPLDEPIPSDDHFIHFGRGQTEVFLELPRGKHTLQLLLGDHDHIPHDPPVMSDRITVVVP